MACLFQTKARRCLLARRSMSSRGKFSASDEAKFALLEPDGTSGRRKKPSATVTQTRGCIVLVFLVIGLLLLWRPSPSSSTTYVAPSSVLTSDDVVVNAAAVSTASTDAGGSAAGSSAAGSKAANSVQDDVVTPSKAAAVAVEPQQASKDLPDDDDEPPAQRSTRAPSPDRQSWAEYLGFVRKKAKTYKAKGKVPPSSVMNKMKALEKEIKSGKSFEEGELGMRVRRPSAHSRCCRHCCCCCCCHCCHCCG